MENNGSFGSNDSFDVLIHPETRGFFNKDEEVLFSNTVKKINKHRVSQKRTLVITNKYLYNICLEGNIFNQIKRLISPKSTLRRKIDIRKISEITLSTHPNSKEFIIHVEGEYDYRYDGGTYRDEIIKTLCNLYFRRKNGFFTFYLNGARDLRDFQTTDDDLKKNICRKQTYAKLRVTSEIIHKGIDFIISNKDKLTVYSEEETGLSVIPEASIESSNITEQSFNRGPIRSIADIVQTDSVIIPKNLVQK